MNPEIRTEWTNALGSGEYEQGTGMLRSADDKFCCLGVLCDIAVKHGVIPPPDLASGVHGYRYGSERDSGVLPVAVVDWAGLNYVLPSVGDTKLSDLNDDGTPFPEIADLIERHL